MTGDHDARIIGVGCRATSRREKPTTSCRRSARSRKSSSRIALSSSGFRRSAWSCAAKIAGNGGGIDPQRRRTSSNEAEQLERVEIARCVNAIHGRGAIVKDIDEGLVDFPAVREGAEILLCWRLGEDEVAHWHGLEEGFAGRKRLDPRIGQFACSGTDS